MLSTENATRMCPTCGGDTTVYSTKEMEDGIVVRRRKCVQCGTKFQTVEIFQKIIKRNSKKFSKSLNTDKKRDVI